MKRLKHFTLLVMMCLLGINHAWAADYIYFKNYYQLSNGTTSFNCLSAPLYWSDSSTPATDQIKKDHFSWYVEAYEGVQINGGYTTVSDGKYTIDESSSLSFSGTGVMVITAIDEFGYVTKNLQAATGSFPTVFGDWSGNVQIAKDDFANAEVGDVIRGYIENRGDGFAVALKNGPGYGDWYGHFGGASSNVIPDKITNDYFEYNITASNIDELKEHGCGFQGKNFTLNSVDLVKKGKASYKIRVLAADQKKVWDFNKLPISIGPHESTWRLNLDNNWSYQEYSEGSEKVYQYNNSVNGNNADLVADTEGLTFTTTGERSFGVYNNDYAQGYMSGGTLQRFISMSKGSKLVIPNLSAGDHVRMYIDKYGGIMTLNFNNLVQDAVGTTISGDYTVGGTAWDADNKGNYSLNGYYNFTMSGNGNFEMTLNSSSDCNYMKIYYIEVYSGDIKIANEVLSTNKGYTLVSKYGEDHSVTAQYYLHFRGKAEQNIKITRILSTGTLQLTQEDFDATTYNGINCFSLKTSSIKDKFGAFKLCLGAKDVSGNYITDYAERIMSVGYYQEVGHPYTWDFSDVKGFSSTLINNDYSNYHNNSVYAPTGTTLKDVEDMNNWANDGSTFVHTRNNPAGAPFAWGSQLYAYNQMIPETIGLQFYPLHMGNGTISMTADGLKIESSDDAYSPDAADSEMGDVVGKGLSDGYDNSTIQKKSLWETPWLATTTDNPEPYTAAGYPQPLFYDASIKSDPRKGWKITISDIPNLTAIYFRVQTISGKKPKVTLDFIRTDEVDGVTAPNMNAKWNYFKKIVENGDGTKDIIYGVSPTQSNTTEPFSIILNNVVLKKIATSKDMKFIGKTGHATESRQRTIDHRLSEFFTNEPIKAYQGKFNDDYSKIVLKEVEIMERATSDNQIKYGTIMIHTSGTKVEGTDFLDKTVNVIDGGFHLFVPDMHDYQLNKNFESGGEAVGDYVFNGQGADDVSDNVLISKGYNQNIFDYVFNTKLIVSPYSVDNTNLVLSAKKYVSGGDGTDTGNGYDVYFLRVDPNKTGASIAGHTSYIQIPTNEMTALTSGSSSSSAKVSILFEDELFEEEQGIATGISDVSQNNSQKAKEWYMLDGRKLNGVPTQKGLYIVNGRKVMVK